MKDYIKIVDTIVENAKKEDPKYGDSVALGRLKAILSIALEAMDRAVRAFDHEDAVMHLRFPIVDMKMILKRTEEL